MDWGCRGNGGSVWGGDCKLSSAEKSKFKLFLSTTFVQHPIQRILLKKKISTAFLLLDLRLVIH